MKRHFATNSPSTPLHQTGAGGLRASALGLNAASKLALVLLLNAATACSLKPEQPSFTFVIDTTAFQESQQALQKKGGKAPSQSVAPGIPNPSMVAPSQFFASRAGDSYTSGFSCLAVNVSGPTIPTKSLPSGKAFHPHYSPQTFSSALAVVRLKESEPQVEVELPMPALGRVHVAVWGIQSENGACPTLGVEDSVAAVKPSKLEVYELAHSTIDLQPGRSLAKLEASSSDWSQLTHPDNRVLITASGSEAEAPELTYPESLIVATSGQNLTIEAATFRNIASLSISPALPTGMSISSNDGSIFGTPQGPMAESPYTITAANSSGSSVAVTLRLRVRDAAPSALAYSATAYTFTVGTAPSPQPSPTVSGGAPTQFSSAPELPHGLGLSSLGVITGTPSAWLLPTAHTITARNETGSSSFTLSLRVNQPTPTLSYSASPYTATRNSAFSITPTAGSSAASFSISPSLTAGLSFNSSTGVISGSPTTTSSALTYTVTAKNLTDQSVTDTFSLRVRDAAPSALTYSATAYTFTVGTAPSPQPSPTVSGGAPTQFSSAPILPAGLGLSSSGVITGTPTNYQFPAVSHTITASNETGSSSFTLSLRVNQPTPTFAYLTGTHTFEQGSWLSVNPTTFQNVTGGVSFIPGLPAGLSINLTTGEIFGTPQATSSPTIYTVTRTNQTGQSATATVTLSIIAATTKTIRFLAPSAEITEAAGASHSVQVTLSAASQTATTVKFKLSPLFTHSDYTNTSPLKEGSITIPIGATTGQITFSLSYNGATERSKFVQLSLEGSETLRLGAFSTYRLKIKDYPSGSLTLTQLATGQNHACGISNLGKIFCWGDNSFGQLGLGAGTDTAKAVPTVVSAPSSYSASAISAGSAHTCALVSGNFGGSSQTNQLYCWGKNSDGQIGAGNNQHQYAPVAISAGTMFLKISAGDAHTCAIKNDQKILCWGANASGQLGIGNSDAKNQPAEISGSGTYQEIAAGNQHTCAVQQGTQKVDCWGSNTHGQSAQTDTSQNFTTPTAVSAFNSLKVSRLATGAQHTCAITGGNANLSDNGKLYCWGNNNYGQLGLPTSGQGSVTWTTTPTLIAPMLTYSEISAKGHTTCAVLGGKTRCWGNNDWGQLGVGDRLSSFILNPVGPYGIVSAGGTFSCGIEQGSTYCWGDNRYGQLANSTFDQTKESILPLPLNTIAAGKLSLGDEHACAITTDNALYCWGDNRYGQLGDGTTISRSHATKIGSGYSSVVAGARHTCAIRASDSKLFCWGDNTSGQLGDATQQTGLVPTPVYSSLAFSSMALGGSHTCAISSTSSLYCWGKNTEGQLGIGGTSGVSVPTQVVAPLNVNTVQAVSAGENHTCARALTNGLPQVYCWGDHSFGQLGNNTQVGTDSNSPFFVLTSLATAPLKSGKNHTCTIRADDSKLVCWGRNDQGQLGDNSTSNRISPVIPSDLTTPITRIALGAAHTCAETSSKIYCWGDHSSLQGGGVDSGLTYRTTPNLVMTSQSGALFAGGASSCQDHGTGSPMGNVTCWGSRGNG
ncbi:MAG: hypothetical protein RJB38_1596, partial [Pseudomonadota bacterium]